MKLVINMLKKRTFTFVEAYLQVQNSIYEFVFWFLAYFTFIKKLIFYEHIDSSQNHSDSVHSLDHVRF